MYISNHFDIYTIDIHLYTPRLSENVGTYFVHTRGLTYTLSRLSLVYIINTWCEPCFTDSDIEDTNEETNIIANNEETDKI